MRKEQFIAFMDTPEKLSGDSVTLLEGLVKEFPYCQTAQLLLVKGLHNENSIRYGSMLKIAAAHAGDRKVLYQLIMRKAPAETTVDEPASAETNELAVTENDSEILNNLEISAQEEPKPVEEPAEIKTVEEPEPAEIPAEPIVKAEEPAATEEKQDPEEKKEPETEQQPEIKPEEEVKEEPQKEEEPPVAFSVDDIPTLEQNILAEAISKSIELEVGNEIPEERPEVQEETVAEAIEEQGSEEQESFDESGSYSFTEWLKHAKPGKKEAENTAEDGEDKAEPKKRSRKNIDDLIDKFIREEPKISRPGVKQDFFSPVNQARQSVQEADDLITETLANIYLKQGSYAKALRAYESLILKFPEKKLYFAARIKEIKKIIKEQK